jgi:RNA methyltransferase, TrmH family
MLSKTQLKYIQSLGQKKSRDEEGLFIAEGPKIVDEFLTLPVVAVKQVYALKIWADENSAKIGNTELHEIDETELGRISQLKTPNHVLAVVKKFESDVSPDLKNKITLALDTIQDPGNMGTIIRIADWFGVKNIICSKDSADIYNPKVVQATMGSISRVNIVYTDLQKWLSENKSVGIYATAVSGKPINIIGKLNEGIIIIGNESKGISGEVLTLATAKISIPRIGVAESLNAAVATGIILSHIC